MTQKFSETLERPYQSNPWHIHVVTRNTETGEEVSRTIYKLVKGQELPFYLREIENGYSKRSNI